MKFLAEIADFEKITAELSLPTENQWCCGAAVWYDGVKCSVMCSDIMNRKDYLKILIWKIWQKDTFGPIHKARTTKKFWQPPNGVYMGIWEIWEA